jgi:hypothetical protein
MIPSQNMPPDYPQHQFIAIRAVFPAATGAMDELSVHMVKTKFICDWT